jgi:hypothetical protein
LEVNRGKFLLSTAAGSQEHILREREENAEALGAVASSRGLHEPSVHLTYNIQYTR